MIEEGRHHRIDMLETLGSTLHLFFGLDETTRDYLASAVLDQGIQA
jgi:hypothetical protein